MLPKVQYEISKLIPQPSQPHVALSPLSWTSKNLFPTLFFFHLSWFQMSHILKLSGSWATEQTLGTLRKGCDIQGKCQLKCCSLTPKGHGSSHNMLDIYIYILTEVQQEPKWEGDKGGWKKLEGWLWEGKEWQSHSSPSQGLFKKCSFLFYIALHWFNKTCS